MATASEGFDLPTPTEQYVSHTITLRPHHHHPSDMQPLATTYLAPTPLSAKFASLTPTDFLAQANKEAALYRSDYTLTNFATGGFVFQNNTSATGEEEEVEPKILLIRRAAAERAFPLKWEVPGGGVDVPGTGHPGDAHVLDALVREVWEETGLVVRRVLREVVMDEDTAEDGKLKLMPIPNEKKQWYTDLPSGRSSRFWRKFNFEVEVVDDGRVKLDPHEHSEWGWFREEDVIRGMMELTSQGQKRLILRAFEMKKGK